ncbi:DUF2878 domain-containing protein [Endozoicomonas arenosclerae]|uniref:DUF2878 domain-containing protein n=1 Tax=Endozoicomonas arenosclerae TaxID=1633495 RepID=UPI0007854C33|nr:DUF2878 domain-containing protein [Endozoicomonas arenosclerae]
MKQLHASLLNASLALAGWLICLVTQSTLAVFAAAIIVAIHLYFFGSWKKEREILAITLILGSALDSVMSNMGVLHFLGESRILPPWLACVWVMLGITIRHSLSWAGKNRLAGNLLIVVLAAAHYLALIQFSDISVTMPLWQAIMILSISATILINIILTFSAVWLEKYRRQNPE